MSKLTFILLITSHLLIGAIAFRTGAYYTNKKVLVDLKIANASHQSILHVGQNVDFTVSLENQSTLPVNADKYGVKIYFEDKLYDIYTGQHEFLPKGASMKYTIPVVIEKEVMNWEVKVFVKWPFEDIEMNNNSLSGTLEATASGETKQN